MRFLVVAVVCAVALVPRSAQSQGDDEDTRLTLKGIRAVHVRPLVTAPPLLRGGINDVNVRTDVELELRRAGIGVLTEAQWQLALGRPRLVMLVDGFDDGGVIVYAVRAFLMQDATLLTNPARAPHVSSWGVEHMGTVELGKVQTIRNGIRDKTRQFINAWLSVNPR